MTQPLIAQEYYEQIVNKFKKYNSYDSDPTFEFRIERIAHNGFVLVYTDTTTQFQFEQTFWYSTFDERPLPTQISLALGYYDIYKRRIKSLCDLYPELKEKIWSFSTGYRNKNGDFTEHMNFSTELTEQEFHNDVQLRITPCELIVSVDTLINKEQADSVVKHTELQLYFSSYPISTDIRNLVFEEAVEELAFNVLTRDLTYQFKKHFGDKLLDY